MKAAKLQEQNIQLIYNEKLQTLLDLDFSWSLKSNADMTFKKFPGVICKFTCNNNASNISITSKQSIQLNLIY